MSKNYYSCIVGDSPYTPQATNSSDHEVYAESDTEPWSNSGEIDHID